ncbi:uncharacterized protein YacL [Pseudarthrobacter siccitolerans]|uniref:Uncharacterized protein YacL n=1 Tax=Pseudarthrobacter siccitolerans TaxID=861266 RepID=A0ABU0PG62_9MICC|nr:hypothetical protein [Pseudarthrobacter siccitolerans]MDQ0672954.1 uncharacterized protein YacL [Pseudarthrobacter siccitolerans]
MNLKAQDKRGLFIGLIVGLLTSAGVAAASGMPVYAFMWSAVTVVLVLVLMGVVLGLVRR